MSNTTYEITPIVTESATSGVVTQNLEGDDQSIRSRRRRRNCRPKSKIKENYFKRETVEMNENVFQTLTESGDRRQFTKTVEALERDINKKLKYPVT